MFCGSLPTEVLTLIGSFASTHAPDKSSPLGDLRDARPGGQQDDRVLTMLFPGCCAPLYHSRVTSDPTPSSITALLLATGPLNLLSSLSVRTDVCYYRHLYEHAFPS